MQTGRLTLLLGLELLTLIATRGAVELTQLGAFPPHAPGPVFNVAVSSQKAFLAASAGGLIIVDVVDPAKPKFLGAYQTSGEARDVALRGDTVAFVAASMGGIDVVDVSNPTRPTLLSRFDPELGPWVYGVFVVDTILYAAGSQGLDIIDAADPRNLKLLGHWQTGAADQSLSVFVEGSYAYACDITGLQIIDVSQPEAPKKVGHYYTNDPNKAAGYRDLYVRGKYAYVAAGFWFEVLDVSNVSAPQRVGFIETDGFINAVEVIGNLAYVADGGTPNARGLRVFDVSVPEKPKEISRAPTTSAAGLRVADGYAFVADGSYGLRTIDVRDAAAPVTVGLYRTEFHTTDMKYSGGHLFLSDAEAGLNVIDVHDPAHPVQVGALECGVADEIDISGNLAFVQTLDHGLQIVDISVPASPTLVGTYHSAGGHVSVDVNGSYAYVGGTGVEIIDISNPKDPSLAAPAPAGWALCVRAKGNLAFVCTYLDGLQILDVSNPAAPRRVGAFPTPSARSVTIGERYVYLVDEFTGLSILDVTTPAQPVRIGEFRPPGPSGQNRSQRFEVSGRYGFLSHETGLIVLDLIDPANPVKVGERVGATSRLQVVGNLLYAISGGIQIFEVSVTPKLGLQMVNGKLELTWEASFPEFRLQRSPSLTAPSWSDVSGALPVEANETSQFYRLQMP